MPSSASASFDHVAILRSDERLKGIGSRGRRMGRRDVDIVGVSVGDPMAHAAASNFPWQAKLGDRYLSGDGIIGAQCHIVQENTLMTDTLVSNVFNMKATRREFGAQGIFKVRRATVRQPGDETYDNQCNDRRVDAKRAFQGV